MFRLNLERWFSSTYKIELSFPSKVSFYSAQIRNSFVLNFVSLDSIQKLDKIDVIDDNNVNERANES